MKPANIFAMFSCGWCANGAVNAVLNDHALAVFFLMLLSIWLGYMALSNRDTKDVR